MLPHRFLPQSLKTRVTLMTLAIVVVSFLVLAFYSKSLLREELLLYTGQQQRSALSLFAAEVNYGLQDRLDTLDATASRLTPKLLEDPASATAFLLDQPFLARQFNAGVMVWDQQGALQTEAPYVSDGSMAGALDAQALAGVLQGGQPVIGRIHTVDNGKKPRFAMAVPIRDPQGVVVGALGGVIRLDQANFLSQLTSHTYGKTGNFFLVDASQRLIFATSDAMRLFEVLPVSGVSPSIDRFVQGFEGTTQVAGPTGEDVLVSVQQIPLARWYASVTLTPAETFALIDNVKLRARLAALVLALICVSLIWLMLRRQLAPMTAAVTTLDGFVRQNQAPQALPVVLDDEVGQLVGGFNRLLDTLAQQQHALLQKKLFLQAVLNSVTAEIAVLSHEGVILEVNEVWQRQEAGRARVAGQNDPGSEVGTNFLQACAGIEAAQVPGEGMTAQDGIRAVLNGQLPRFYLEYARHSPSQKCWYSMSVTPLSGAARQGAVVSLDDITSRIQMENQVRELAFYDPLTRLPNRRLALERLSQQLARARRDKASLALLYVDLDKFKPINDELGHEVGDWLLQAVAQRILGCLRASDTAARMGGDEFVVLLPDQQSSETAVAVAEKICQALAQEFVTEQGIVLSISSSIGVALYPDHGNTEKDMLRLGDEAMYQAKKSSRNAVFLCLPAAAQSGPGTGAEALRSYVHLRWKAAFNSGHAVIDRQHENLFLLANNLLDKAALRHQQPQAFETAYEALVDHIVTHFEHEEAILRDLGYVDLAQHAQQHQLLLTRATTLHRQFQQAPEKPGAEAALTKFLVTELVAGHMLHADRDFFALFARS
ncbi:diguanylate cyclase [Rhodoferax sp.]|uniref:diguanylate cyclase domain-containing protein n=1 Tax=Rhodoferax sp. TaxID=50421 RepID=UPI0025CF6C32|nr:diguanylate cyclase [Rhodoferax sp.]